MTRGDRKPRLAGVRVLVTRPRERSRELCFLLEDEGAQVVSLPLLEFLPPDDERPLRCAAEQIHQYAWVAFASPLAVRALLGAVRQAGTFERLERLKLAAVGPGTASELAVHRLTVAKQAQLHTGAGLAEVLVGSMDTTSRCWSQLRRRVGPSSRKPCARLVSESSEWLHTGPNRGPSMQHRFGRSPPTLLRWCCSVRLARLKRSSTWHHPMTPLG